MAKTEKEEYDINHRWVDTAEDVWTLSPSMKVYIKMADYKKDGDYTWVIGEDEIPCDFMELMLIPPKDSRFYTKMLQPDEALVAQIYFTPSGEPVLDDLVLQTPEAFHLDYPFFNEGEARKFAGDGGEIEFTEDEYSGIIDFARKTREFHAALGIKEYVGESVAEKILDEHILSSEEPEDTKRFAEWVNNEFGADILSQKNAEKILEYYAEHEFDLLIGSDGKLYEYDPQEEFPDGFSEQSFENIIENTMGMIEQNGEIERESNEMKAILKADLKAMEKVAEKMIDAKENKKSRDELSRRESVQEKEAEKLEIEAALENMKFSFTINDKEQLDRIKAVFGITSDMSEYAEYIARAENAALDVYEPPAKYSFKEYAAGQMARALLTDKYPEISEIEDFFDYWTHDTLDDLCTKIGMGNFKSFDEVKASLSNIVSEAMHEYHEKIIPDHEVEREFSILLEKLNENKNTFTINDTEQLDRLKSVFDIALDMSAYAEYITRAERDAFEFYSDSTQKENGYSFKDYAGGQMALGFLSDMYPELSLMEDYLPDLGWKLDDICTSVASGEIKSIKELQESLAETINELKESATEKDIDKIDIYLEDISAEKPVLSSALEKISDFMGTRVTAEDFNEFIEITDWNENENLEYRITDMLSVKLQSSVATIDELEKDDNCKLQDKAFNLAGEILSGEKTDRNSVLAELKAYGMEIDVIEEKDEPAPEGEKSKEHDRAMRNLRTALGGIKNGYSDSLDDYIESMYTRKGMWSVHQKTEKETPATEIRYSDITVFEISEGEMRIPAGAKTTLAELEKKGILAEDVRKEVAKMYPDFRLSLTKKEFAMLEKVIANTVTVDAENKCAFRESDGAYLSARKVLEYTAPEKLSQMERDTLGDRREKLSDSDKKVLESIQKKLSEISAEKTPDEALSPALKDLHAALDGIVNRRNNNLDVYIEDRKTEKGSWSITRSSDNLNGQISIDYNGKPFAIIEKNTVALLATKDKIEKMGINIEDVMSEIGAFDERFNVSLTKEEASFIDEISQTLREHDSIIVGEKEHPYDMDRKCYISRQSLLEYIDTELDEINPEQKKEWLASLTEEKRSLYESLKEKLSEDGISENVKDMNTEMKKSGDLREHMMDGLSDVIQGYIIGNTSDLDEYDPGHVARKGVWSIREKAADEDTGDMSEFDVVYQDEYIVATVKNGKITDRLDEVQFLKEELSFDKIADAVKLAYPKIKEKEGLSDKTGWKPVSDMTRWNGKTAEERFKMLEQGADAMSAEKFGTAENFVEKAFMGLSDTELVSLMEMKDEDGNTAIEIWENEYSYLQNVNEIEDFEDRDVVPSSFAEVKNAQDKADGIKFMREKDGQLRLRHGKYRAAETLMNFVNEKFSSEILDMPDADRILYEYWETSSDIIIDEKNGSLFWQHENEEMENVDVFDMLNDIEIWNNGLVEEGRANDPVMKERYEQTNEMLSRVKENIKKAREEKTVSVSEKPISEYTTQELWNEINHRDDFLGGKIWVKDDIELYFVDHSDEFEELGYENIKVDEKLVDRVADNIHPDWLSDCTDAEWSVFDTAWRDTLKDMQKEKAEKIKNQAVSATHGIDVNSVLKEAKEKKRKNKEVGQPAQKKNSGIER